MLSSKSEIAKKAWKTRKQNLANQQKQPVIDNSEIELDVEECRFLQDRLCNHPKFKGKEVICGHMTMDDCELAERRDNIDERA